MLTGRHLSLRKGVWQRFGEVAGFPGFDHGIDVVHSDDVHTGIGPVVIGFTLDDLVVDHLDRVIAPAPVLLTDQAVDQAVLHVLQFHRQGVEDDVLELSRCGRFLPQRHRASLGKQRPQADEEPAVQVRIGLHRLFDHLDPLVDVVIAGHRGHDFDVRVVLFDLLGEAPDALLQVEGAGHAGQQGHLAFGAHSSYQQVSRCFSTVVVADPQVGETIAVRGVRIPGHHLDTRFDGLVDGIDAAIRVVAGDPDGINALGDHILHHPGLLGHIGSYRADILDFHFVRPLLGQFFSLDKGPVTTQFKDRVVEGLRNPGNGDLTVGQGRMSGDFLDRCFFFGRRFFFGRCHFFFSRRFFFGRLWRWCWSACTGRQHQGHHYK